MKHYLYLLQEEITYWKYLAQQIRIYDASMLDLELRGLASWTGFATG